MRQIITLAFLLVLNAAFGQHFNEKQLKTEIAEVTVFLNGAQIFETGTTILPSGKTILQMKNLSPFLDEKSIRVKAEGDFTILSVNHKLNYLNELKKDTKIDSLKKAIELIELSVSKENARLEVLHEKLSLLNANKNLGGQHAGASIIHLKQAIDFYESEISKIKDEEINIKKGIGQKKQEQGRLENQLRELNQQNTLPSSEIEIRINSDFQTNGSFQITYLVSNAGWYPKYDIRVQDIKSPLELTYKAEVHQNTGVDWKDVKLRFSNGTPNQSSVIPELITWNLNYARNTIIEKAIYGLTASLGNVKGRVLADDGSPLPGVNIVVKGSSIGTVTDAGGNYSLTLPNGATQLIFSFVGMITEEVLINKPEINVRMQEDISQLSEVVVVGYGVQGRAPGVQVSRANNIAQNITTTVIENQTTVEIEVQTPYSIKSNGDKLLVDLKKLNIDAIYEYYAIPKLDKNAFLVARVIHWDKYNLLEGEANLYFEDAYVGRSILDAKALQDTLDISLGRDKNIVIGREKNEQFSKSRSIGSNVVETRGFKIMVRNTKSIPIKLTLYDQIPVSVVSDITVNAVEVGNGQFDSKRGRLSWELNVVPQQQRDINFQYEVRYPKREKVLLE
ncbi:MAG: mucoidy inhibitor MuiA family protein [Cyclobacteriaceae bacterium]|nr:mucoidy inhibitor MuiA family protein [Cyclobacteriaceae bacterium]